MTDWPQTVSPASAARPARESMHTTVCSDNSHNAMAVLVPTPVGFVLGPRPARESEYCPTMLSRSSLDDEQAIRTPPSSSTTPQMDISLSYYSMATVASRVPHSSATWSRPTEAQRCAIALRVYRQSGSVLGRDDTLLHDQSYVFVVDHISYDLPAPIQQVDYFHGVVDGYVIAQLDYQKCDVFAYDMIHMRGSFAMAVRYIQRIFKAKKAIQRLFNTVQATRLLPNQLGRYPLIVYHIAKHLPRHI